MDTIIVLLACICVLLFILISNDSTHFERIDIIVRKLDEIINKLDKIEKDRSN